MGRLENVFKVYLLKVMGTRWDVQSHEDRYSVGIPDLSFGLGGVNGWIELKQIKECPSSRTAIIKPEKYTPNQVNWLLRRDKKGGNCYVMVRVGKNQHYLFKAGFARQIAYGTDLHSYNYFSICKWDGPIVPEELMAAILGRPATFEDTIVLPV